MISLTIMNQKLKIILLENCDSIIDKYFFPFIWKYGHEQNLLLWNNDF